MTTVLVFDIETIPDVAGLRRLEDFPASMADADVAKQVMQLRLDKTGSDFLPLYLQRIVAISCVIRRTTKEGLPQIKVGSLGNPDDSEKVLIQAFIGRRAMIFHFFLSVKEAHLISQIKFLKK